MRDLPMIDVQAIATLHKETVRQWHEDDIDNHYEGFLRVVCLQHEQNYRLWHQEDIARSPVVCDTDLAQVKRNIDQLNQRRNDLIEQLDDLLVGELAAAGIRPDADARLNTETPGSVIDRLSILSLRIYHMQEQAGRADAGQQHRVKAEAKLDVLHEQQKDLGTSLAELLTDILSGRKCLKVYRQFKMYNDPTMNPYLYNSPQKPAA